MKGQDSTGLGRVDQYWERSDCIRYHKGITEPFATYHKKWSSMYCFLRKVHADRR